MFIIAIILSFTNNDTSKFWVNSGLISLIVWYLQVHIVFHISSYVLTVKRILEPAKYYRS